MPLLAGNNWGTDVYVEGFPTGPDVDNNSRYNEVGPGYFRTLGIPVLAGREFTPSDFKGTSRVAVVNQAFAKKFHLERDALHKFMSTGGPDSLNIEIVGLAQNAKYSDVKDPVPPLFFMPWRQEGARYLNFYVRTALPPAQQFPAITALLKRMAPTVPIEDLKTMPQQIRDNVFLDRLISILSAVFAGAGHAARRGGALRRAGVHRAAAHPRDRRPHGARRRRLEGAGAGRPADGRDDRDRRRDRHRLRAGPRPGAAVPAVRPRGQRPGGVRAVADRARPRSRSAASYVPVQRASRVDPVEALRYE